MISLPVSSQVPFCCTIWIVLILRAKVNKKTNTTKKIREKFLFVLLCVFPIIKSFAFWVNLRSVIIPLQNRSKSVPTPI